MDKSTKLLIKTFFIYIFGSALSSFFNNSQEFTYFLTVTNMLYLVHCDLVQHDKNKAKTREVEE